MLDNKEKITIVTHNSGFHTDDVFAVATLLIALGENNDISIIRSRDQEIIEKADYVLDVGGINDPEKNRFDHHQIGGAGVRENSIPYASFGLVWKKYGEHISGSVNAAKKIDQDIVQPVDANDNGVSFLESKVNGLRPFDIGFLNFLFYPTWKENIENIDEIFLKMVSYAKVIVEREIQVVKDEIEGTDLVLQDYESAEDKRLIILGNNRYPWGEVLSKISEPLFVVYKNITADTWTIKGIRNDLLSYESRKDLPINWAGKTGEELEKITGVAGAVFCHNKRFMAVAKTKEAILKLAEIALQS